MSVWHMGGTGQDVAGDRCRAAMGSEVQWVAGHGAVLWEAPGHPASPQSPWQAGADTGPASAGQLLKRNVAFPAICPHLSLICAVRLLQTRKIHWQLPGVRSSPMPDGRIPEGCFWCAFLPPASHVSHQLQNFPLSFWELLHPMGPHKCHAGGEEGAAGTREKGLGLWLGLPSYSQFIFACRTMS